MASLRSLLPPALILAGRLSAAPELEPEVRRLLSRHVEALGGLAALQAQVSEERISELTIMGRKERETLIQDLRDGRRYRRTEPTTGSFEGGQEEGYDGTQVWEKSIVFQGVKSEQDAAKDRARYTRKPLWRFESDPDTRYRALPDMVIEGVNCRVLEATVQGESILYYLDPGTALVRASRTGTRLTHYTDYRKVSGVQVAFQTRMEVAPGLTLNRQVLSVKFNVALDPERFRWKGPKDTAAPAIGVEAFEAPERPFGREDEIPEALRLKTLEVVWQRVKSSYYDPTFNGVDWDRLLPVYRAKLAERKRSEAFHALLQEMVNELGRSHLRVGAPHATTVIGGQAPAGAVKEGSLEGVRFRWLEGQVVVASLPEKAPAWAAGLRPGDAIEAVEGRSVAALQQDPNRVSGRGYRPGDKALAAVREALAGPLDRKVRLNVSDPRGRSKSLEIPRSAGSDAGLLGGGLEAELREVAPGIGYLRLARFTADVKTKVQQSLAAHPGLRGLILDLRGNPGGIGNVASDLASLLHVEGGLLALNKGRTGSSELRFPGGGPGAYTGPLLILVDERSASTAEVLTAALQESGRARVLGTLTAGAVLPSVPLLLPTGGSMVLPVAELRSPKGVLLEGQGITPDVQVQPTRADLEAGRDPVLEQALRMLKQP